MRTYLHPSSQRGQFSARPEVRLAVLLAVILIAATSCRERSELPESSEQVEAALPLLVISGPDDLTRFELRDSNAEVIWRLDADVPSEIPFLVYDHVPDGFRQALPKNDRPRPLLVGEELTLTSRTPTHVFLHHALASSESTVTILESEMRRVEPEHEYFSVPDASWEASD